MTSVTVPVVNQWSGHIAQVLCANLSATLMMIVHDCKCVLTGSLLCTHFRNEEWLDFFFDKCVPNCKTQKCEKYSMSHGNVILDKTV